MSVPPTKGGYILSVPVVVVFINWGEGSGFSLPTAPSGSKFIWGSSVIGIIVIPLDDFHAVTCDAFSY